MLSTTDDLVHGLAVGRPSIAVGPGRSPLPTTAFDKLVRVVADTHLHVPHMFELTFYDVDGAVLRDAGLELGTELEIRGGATGQNRDWSLVVGEVTAIEGMYDSVVAYTVVRGYSQDHRLQRTRRTRTFLNAKDSDVAGRLADQAGLQVGQVVATTASHEHLAQRDQTDWDFLTGRAREIGYEVGVQEGRFYFRPARSTSDTAPLPVRLGDELLRFHPRVSAANLVPEVEVRTWDPAEAKVIAARAATASTAVSVGAGTAGAAAKTTMGSGAPAAAGGTGTAGSAVGPAPTTNGYVVLDRALPVPASSDAAVTGTAKALAEHVASSFAEADGELVGDARVIAGAVLKVDRVPAVFAGNWVVTRARHVYDFRDVGYRTRFEVSGRHDRSLLALSSSSGGRTAATSRVDGVVCGLVNDVNDPLGLGRVKLMLPWLSPDYLTDWAPVSQLGAGQDSGALFLPGVDEQVLVAFEFGDLRRPYVLGSLVNNRTGAGCQLDGGTGSAKPGATAVRATGEQAAVIRRGFVSPTGSRIVLHDEAPPSGGEPSAAEVIVGTGKDKLALLMDAVAGTLTLRCNPDKAGRLIIECGGSTAVEIKAGPSGSMTVDGGQQLTLKGGAVQLEATGVMTIKGKTIQLN